MVKKAAQARPNHLLRAARKQRGWTQKQVADRIGAPLSLNITRWERGTATPSAHYVEQLCQLFDTSPQELGLLPVEEQPPTQEPASEPPRPWNVPSSLAEAPAAARAQAEALVVELDGLPLALDQAGAYLEETGCSLAAYLQLYQQRRGELLKRQSSVPSAYPHTVASTWSLSFQQVQQASPAAADLLRLCAFLHPDVIPESIVTDGAAFLGPALAPVDEDSMLLDEAISVLRRYSLVKRDAEAKLLHLHRLVQAMLQESMDAATRRQWAERVVRAVNATFPEVVFANWAQCELCLPQALVCAELIEQHTFRFPEAARLLDHAGAYLRDRARYGQAMPLLQRALAIGELAWGPDHPQTALTLSNLAQVCYLQGHYDQAEALLQRALTICEQTVGPDHLETASVLYQLQWLYYLAGKQEEP